MAKDMKSSIQVELERARAIQAAKAWLPEQAGDYFTGKLIAIKRGVSKWGSYPLAIFECEDGEFLAFHAFHGVPKARLIEANPQIGDVVSISYDGKVPPKNEGEDPMNMYTVIVDGKPAANEPWDNFA